MPPSRDASGPSRAATPDLHLVRRALARERQAVELLVQRLRCVAHFVHRLNRMLGCGLGADQLEDVVQQVHAALWPRLRDYSGAAALESWVYGFCRNCLRATTRHERRRFHFRSLDVEGEEGRECVAELPHPTESLFRAEGIDALRAALDALAPEERLVVELRHLEDWSFEAIAAHLALPASTVKDRCYRALLKMRARLRSHDVHAG